MYAVIETGGKQYKVEVGTELYIELLNAASDEVVEFKALAIGNDDGALTVGAPYISGAKVAAKVIKSGKAKKIVVSTYKPKKGYKRTLGHRQPYTKVQIESISL